LSCRTEHRQRGLASLEFVLILPILIVITFLAVAMARLGHLRLDMQISARNQAYEDAYGWKSASNPGLPFGLGATDIDKETPWYVPGTTVTHPTVTANAGDNFYAESATGHERFGILRFNGVPTKITPTAYASSTNYQAVRALGSWQITVREQYAVAAVPIWERKQIPIGYDQYLYDELRKVHFVVPGIPGVSLIADIPGISLIPGMGDMDEFDFGDLYSGYASDAVIDVFPKVKK
jgi:hypothetical protein